MSTTIGVFVDGDNFSYLQSHHLQWKIDPRKLMDFIKTYGDVLIAKYYMSVDEESKKSKDGYIRVLCDMGYSVVTKNIKRIWCREKEEEKVKADMDVNLTADFMLSLDRVDAIFMVTGDSDFSYIIDIAHARGKSVYVMASHRTVARELRERVGANYIDFADIEDKVKKDEE